MKQRIQRFITPLVFGAIILAVMVAMAAFWSAVLFALLWICAAFPSFVAWSLFGSLLILSVKSIIT